MANPCKAKVFGIGMFKTGLTSLGEALALLGYRFSAEEWYHGKIVDDPWNLHPRLADAEFQRVVERARKYDAHVDYPWMFLFREMDQIFGNARFIYTVRDPERVARSNRNYRRRNGTKEEDLPSSQRIIRRYIEHQRLVMNHFAGRTDLLVVDWEAGAGWEELCQFLETERPDRAFPWANKGIDEFSGTLPRSESCGSDRSRSVWHDG